MRLTPQRGSRRVERWASLRRQHRGFSVFLATGTGTGVAVGFATSLAASLAFGAFQEGSIALFAFAVAVTTLTFALHASLSLTRRSMTLTELQRGAPDDAKAHVVKDVTDSLVRYGLLTTDADLWQFRLVSDRGFRYLRGENFLNLLEGGFVSARSHCRILNDHPFTPFSHAVRPLIGTDASISIINAVPDALYDPSLISDRIQLATAQNVNYRLLPAVDIHLSLIVFDETDALVYGTPAGRTCCCYSEALFTDEPELVRLLLDAFGAVEALAVRYQGDRSTSAILEGTKRVASSGARDG